MPKKYISVGTFVWFFTAAFAVSCGVGGGGIYVPMGILLLRFPPKPASGLSQASIFGSSLGGILVNIRNKHPNQFIRDTKGTPSSEEGKIISHEKDKGPAEIEADRQRYLAGGDGKRKFYTRPLIDYNMALFLAPMEMAGAVLGVIIQQLFPNWLFISFAAVVLGFTSYQTFKKFFVLYKKDKANVAESIRLTMIESQRAMEAAKKVEVEDAAANGNEKNGYDKPEGAEVGIDGEVEMTEMGAVSAASSLEGGQDDPKELEKRRQFLEDDARQYPKEKLAYLILLWIGLTVITFLKGGKGVESVIGITCEDAGFYVLVAAQFLWTMGFAALFGYKNVKGTQERLAVHYPYNESDVLWDAKKLYFYSFFTFVAGIVAGLIGIGGGMILGPLMLAMGIDPRVSTATTATMILLTSSSVAVMFVMSGQVPWEYALYFFCICLLGAFIGKKYIDAWVKKTGMSSLLVVLLASEIALATIGCIIILFMNLAKVDWCLAGFNSFCSVSASEDKCAAAVASRLLQPEELFPY